MSTLGTFEKQPADVEAFPISFADWLAENGDTPLAATLTSIDPSGLTVNAVQLSGTTVYVWCAGGTDGQKYKVTVHMTTVGGRTKEVEITVKVKDT